ncbi:hypothetical protein F4823DRAFT_630598 [Ustulina deusta]|nr:hypothetical protein F4823DRAFT_630598 [Ustulina deusta]
MPNFSDLPLEIRLMVLEILTTGARDTEFVSTDRLATYAVVCKEWQSVLERETFRQLILSPSRLQHLYRNVRYRRSFVKHVWYHVELQRYPCGACSIPETQARIKANNEIATRAMYQLFEALSRWKKDDACAGDGLTLELSVHSPSDSKHYFQNHQFDTFFYSEDDDFDQNPKAQRLTQRRHDGQHRWENSVQSFQYHPTPDVLQHMNLVPRFRVHGQPLRIEKELPEAEIVTRLLVRRQSYRAFGPRALSYILRALPMLEQLHVESWRPLLPQLAGLEPVQDRKMEALFRLSMPIMLKAITWYEDDDGIYELLETNDHPTLPKLAAALLKASTQLESLAISFIADAQYFFMSLSSTKSPALHTFPRLRFIALTSNQLSLKTGTSLVNNLLSTAGTAALRMPMLQIMELWNGRQGEAAIFRYEREPSIAIGTLVWISSWNFFPDVEVVAQWKEVALNHGCRRFLVESDRVSAPPVCPGSILKHLRLQRQILHPISLYQIQREAEDAADIQAWAAAYEIE